MNTPTTDKSKRLRINPVLTKLLAKRHTIKDSLDMYDRDSQDHLNVVQAFEDIDKLILKTPVLVKAYP